MVLFFFSWCVRVCVCVRLAGGAGSAGVGLSEAGVSRNDVRGRPSHRGAWDDRGKVEGRDHSQPHRSAEEQCAAFQG